MKRKMSLIAAVCLGITLCACGSKEEIAAQGENEVQVAEEQEANNISEKKETDDSASYVEEEFIGCVYSVPKDALGMGKSDGVVYSTDNYEIFIYGHDDIEFSSWDTIVEDSEKRLARSLLSAFSSRPESQSVDTSTQITNDNGEELLRVTGQFTYPEDEDEESRDYIAYYHLSADSKVRFFIGFPKNDAFDLDSLMQHIAESVRKQ